MLYLELIVYFRDYLTYLLRYVDVPSKGLGSGTLVETIS